MHVCCGGPLVQTSFPDACYSCVLVVVWVSFVSPANHLALCDWWPTFLGSLGRAEEGGWGESGALLWVVHVSLGFCEGCLCKWRLALGGRSVCEPWSLAALLWVEEVCVSLGVWPWILCEMFCATRTQYGSAHCIKKWDVAKLKLHTFEPGICAVWINLLCCGSSNLARAKLPDACSGRSATGSLWLETK